MEKNISFAKYFLLTSYIIFSVSFLLFYLVRFKYFDTNIAVHTFTYHFLFIVKEWIVFVLPLLIPMFIFTVSKSSKKWVSSITALLILLITAFFIAVSINNYPELESLHLINDAFTVIILFVFGIIGVPFITKGQTFIATVLLLLSLIMGFSTASAFSILKESHLENISNWRIVNQLSCVNPKEITYSEYRGLCEQISSNISKKWGWDITKRRCLEAAENFQRGILSEIDFVGSKYCKSRSNPE